MWGKNTIFENKTGLEVLDEVAENLSANVIGWQTTCGFFDGYGDSGPGGGPLRKVILDNPPEDPGIEDWGGLNAPEDITSNGDGTWNERVFLNKARDFSVKKWTGIVLHELLHGSDQIDTAADILADKFFDDDGEPCNTKEENPLGLNAEQKVRARAIIEENIVRYRVIGIAKEHGNYVAAEPTIVAEDYNKPTIYPDYDLLSPEQLNALNSFMTQYANSMSSPCNLVEDLPLKPIDCGGAGAAGLFVTAENTFSPLILDLDGDGVETLGQNFYIAFDHDKNGFAERTGWAGADDGLLVLDRNGNGRIDNGSELFGNNSGTGPGPANGFAALAEFDSNRDGRIDASDSVFASLRVCKDANSNSLTDAGELLTLQQAGVGSLSLSYTTGTAMDAQGNSHLQLGSYTTTQGAVRQLTDVWFKVDRMRAGGRWRAGRGGAGGLLRKRRAAGARGRSRGLDWLTKTGHDPVRVA
jgi:hypothetical protein